MTDYITIGCLLLIVVYQAVLISKCRLELRYNRRINDDLYRYFGINRKYLEQ